MKFKELKLLIFEMSAVIEYCFKWLSALNWKCKLIKSKLSEGLKGKPFVCDISAYQKLNKWETGFCVRILRFLETVSKWIFIANMLVIYKKRQSVYLGVAERGGAGNMSSNLLS